MSAYTTLGISENATEQQVIKAYRKLAMKHHPDRGGDEEKFKTVKAAFEEIEKNGFRPLPKEPPAAPRPNPNKKPQWEPPKTPGGTWRDSSNSGGSEFESIDELLEKMKRARGAAAPKNVWAEPRSGNELTAEVRIREAFMGFRFDLPGVLGLNTPFVNIPPGMPDGHRGKYQTSNGETKTIITRIHVPEGYHLRGFDSDNLFSAGLNVGDIELDYECDAIDLITGAWITVKDVLGEDLGVRIPPGFNPIHRLKIAGKGYYGWLQEFSRPSNRRMDMYLKVRPIFNKPSDIERHKIINLYNSIEPDARI